MSAPSPPRAAGSANGVSGAPAVRSRAATVAPSKVGGVSAEGVALAGAEAGPAPAPFTARSSKL